MNLANYYEPLSATAIATAQLASLCLVTHDYMCVFDDIIIFYTLHSVRERRK